MKKILFLSSLLVILHTGDLFSAGIYENANQSVEFVRTLTRYASTGIDSAFYNPAGTVFMDDGLYVYLGNQMLFDYQVIDDSSDTLSSYSYPSHYEGNAMTWSFPDVFTVYKQGNWSAYFHGGVIGRGAAAYYEESLPELNKGLVKYAEIFGATLLSLDTEESLEAYAFFTGFTIGGAYKVSNIFSVAAGVRQIHAEQHTELKYDFKEVMTSSGDMASDPLFTDLNIEVDATGNSWGFIGGCDIKPLDELNIGLRYQYYTAMKVTNDTPEKYEGPASVLAMMPFKKGDSTKMTLPMSAAAGVSYRIIPDLTIEGGFIYYFNKLADWGRDTAGKDIASKYDNGFDASISFEYIITKEIRCSMGTSYSQSGVNSKTRSNQQIGLDAYAIAGGATYTFDNSLELTASVLTVFYSDETEKNTTINNIFPDTGTSKYGDRTHGFGISASYKIL